MRPGLSTRRGRPSWPRRRSLVFLDLHLGGSAADELLDELAAAGIPVVLVSGTVDVRAYEGRASAVMPKPFEPAELVETARRLAARQLA